jgi:hypothetical protein
MCSGALQRGLHSTQSEFWSLSGAIACPKQRQQCVSLRVVSIHKAHAAEDRQIVLGATDAMCVNHREQQEQHAAETDHQHSAITSARVRTIIVSQPAVRPFGKELPHCLAMAGVRCGVER